MQVSSINAAGSSATSSISSPKASQSIGSTDKESSGDSAFAKLLEGANNQQIDAENAIQQLATGDATSMHNVVLSAAKADLSFRLVLEMRNKLIESYQEIMRMQV